MLEAIASCAQFSNSFVSIQFLNKQKNTKNYSNGFFFVGGTVVIRMRPGFNKPKSVY